MRKNKVTQRELAEYLGVSVSAVKQYKKEKRIIMQYGLFVLKEIRANGKTS